MSEGRETSEADAPRAPATRQSLRRRLRPIGSWSGAGEAGRCRWSRSSRARRDPHPRPDATSCTSLVRSRRPTCPTWRTPAPGIAAADTTNRRRAPGHGWPPRRSTQQSGIGELPSYSCGCKPAPPCRSPRHSPSGPSAQRTRAATRPGSLAGSHKQGRTGNTRKRNQRNERRGYSEL